MGIGALIAVGIGLLVGALIKPLKIPKAKLNQYRPSTSFSNGFAPVEIDTTTPIPISFGRVQTNGHIIKGHVLGNNNDRLIGALATTEYLGSTTLNDFYIGGIKFNELTTFSPHRNDDRSWFEFVPTGVKKDIHLSNSGVKNIYQQLRTGSEYISDPIRIYGEAGLLFRYVHYASSTGSNHSWDLYYRKASDPTNWILLESQAQINFSRSIKGTAVAVNQQSNRAFSGFANNVYTFRLVVRETTNEGSIQWESIEIQGDTGKNVSFNSPYCSYILFNLIKTNEISRLNFIADINCPYSNPADAIRFLMINEEFGFGKGNVIDQESFSRASEYCDANNIVVGITFSNTSFDEAIELLLNSSGLYIIKTQGIFKLLIDEWNEAEDIIDLDKDIIPSSLQMGSTQKTDVFNRLRVRYTDIPQNFTRNDILLEDADLVASDGYLREKTIDLSAINNMDWAQTIAEKTYKENTKNALWCRFDVGVRNSWYEPGDNLQLISSRLKWERDKPIFFKIISMDEVLQDSGLFGFSIYCEKTEIFTYLKTMKWHNWVEEPAEESTEILNIVKYQTVIKITSVSSHLLMHGTIFDFFDYSREFPKKELWSYDVTITFKQAYGNNVTGYELYGYNSALPSHMRVFKRVPKSDNILSTYNYIRLRNVRADCTWHFKIIALYRNDSGGISWTDVNETEEYTIDIPKKPTDHKYGAFYDNIYDRD